MTPANPRAGLAGPFCFLLFSRVFAGSLHRDQRVDSAQKALNKKQGIRAVLRKEDAQARRHIEYEGRPEHLNWLQNLRGRALMARSAFVHDQANVAGKVLLGAHVHNAAGSSVIHWPSRRPR